MFIAGALALGHALLNVNDEVDLLPGSWAADRRGPGRSLAVNDGLHILRAIAAAQRGAPPAGRPLIAGELERENATPPMYHLNASGLQQGEERREVSGPLDKGGIYGSS